MTGAPRDEALIFWFVLHQGKMNKGKPLQKARSNKERLLLIKLSLHDYRIMIGRYACLAFTIPVNIRQNAVF